VNDEANDNYWVEHDGERVLEHNQRTKLEPLEKWW